MSAPDLHKPILPPEEPGSSPVNVSVSNDESGVHTADTEGRVLQVLDEQIAREENAQSGGNEEDDEPLSTRVSSGSAPLIEIAIPVKPKTKRRRSNPPPPLFTDRECVAVSDELKEAHDELRRRELGKIEIVPVPDNDEMLKAWLERELDPRIKSTIANVIHATGEMGRIKEELMDILTENAPDIRLSDLPTLIEQKQAAKEMMPRLARLISASDLQRLKAFYEDVAPKAEAAVFSGHNYYNTLYRDGAYASSGTYTGIIGRLAAYELSDELTRAYEAIIKTEGAPEDKSALKDAEALLGLLYRPDNSPRRILEVCSGPARVTRDLAKEKRKIDPYMAYVFEQMSVKGPVRQKNMLRSMVKRLVEVRSSDPDLVVTDYCDSVVQYLSQRKGLTAVGADICDPDFADVLAESGVMDRGKFDLVHATLDADRTWDYRAQLKNIRRHCAAPGARFVFSELLPCSNVGNSMTGDIPEFTFWNIKTDSMRRGDLVKANRTDAIVSMVIKLRGEGFIVDRITEHKQAVISPHSCVRVLELCHLWEKNPGVIHTELLPRRTRQVLADAVQQVMPDGEGGFLDPQRQLPPDARIVLPEVDVLTDFGGHIA